MSIDRTSKWKAALIGVLSAGAALGTAELVTAATGPNSSPVTAVGSSAIDLAPVWLKDFAISTFGNYDKPVLLGGILVALVAFAAVAGIVAVRRFAVGAVMIGLLGAVGALAATTRPGASALDALPSLAAILAGAAVLHLLLRADADTDSPSRRTFLAAGAGTAAYALLGASVGRILQQRSGDIAQSRSAIKLPAPVSPAAARPTGHEFSLPGLTPFQTPNRDFYRVDTALVIPELTAEEWSLRIHGMVDRPIELSFADLMAKPLIERDITLCCVSNEVGGPYASTARWLGFPLAQLLREAGVKAGANQLVGTDHAGMTIGTPLEVVMDGRESLLAIGMNGEPLLPTNGFPVRQIVPGLFGYTSATKWLVDLELTTFDKYDAYWTERQWDPIGTVLTASRIDVPKPFAQVPAGPVTVAGVAWAQHRGIGAVQFRVDGGEWQPAQLSTEVSPDTWRQWRANVQLDKGLHRFEVRAADGRGDWQPEERTRPFPRGATGWHSVAVTVT
ncbi:molybdopterin-dependent oxidoreductase [Allokutzneria multivorans]|uniref:molybdopterin-dependent oxidoreductase n=1 Tax=Allokutzneria multivorans TaxID=1142134 RepID=UPI0031EAC701